MDNIDHYTVVKFTNIASFDFEHAYDGRPFFLGAGKSKLLDKPLADHFAKHLAMQILLRESEQTKIEPGKEPTSIWNDAALNELKSKMISEVYVEERPATLSEGERMEKRVAELNDQKEPEDPPVPPATEYKDKAEVIAEMQKYGLPVNARLSKAALEKQLAEARANMAPTT